MPPLIHRYLKDLSEAFARIKAAIHPVADTSDTDEAPSMDDDDTDTDEATTKLLPNDLVSGISFDVLLFFSVRFVFCALLSV